MDQTQRRSFHATSPDNPRQQVPKTLHLASHPKTKPDVAGDVSDHQQPCATELDMGERQSPDLAAMVYTDLEDKWQSEPNTRSSKWNFEQTTSSTHDTTTLDSQRPEGDIVGLASFQIPDISDFNFSFESFFDKDIEFPSWPDSTFSMNGLEYQLDDIGEGSRRRQPMEEPAPYGQKRAKVTNFPPQLEEMSLPHVNQDTAYLTHFERWIASCGYSLKEDGKGNYLRFVLDYIQSDRCSPDSPFRFAVLAWAAKHLAATSISYDESWKTYYAQAVRGLERLSCCVDSNDHFLEPGSAAPTGHLSEHRELAEARETAINLDIRRMDTEFDLAIATNPAANALRHVATSLGKNIVNRSSRNNTANGSLSPHSPLPANTSRDIDRASLQWLSCYAAFLSAKVLWSRFLYPDIRSDSTAAMATSGILKIALQLRQIHRKSRLASLMKVPRSMLWPLPIFIAGIETTDEIYADWISEFMDEMASAMNGSTRERSHATGEYMDTSIGDKGESLTDHRLILILMMRVREKQDFLGRRVDVQGVMGEMDGANDIFLL
ncbi:hypothetical protein THAR02_08699 [Trichoderma harzianum]|uniref:Transcription factor domain-containing protein n=1 Tax=Trichoderma harzianum TaxID=5544 RepID=A0A0G0A1K9_TRIHA|nr:hypothetical protein THAR02_08699 [Trichoderma harzianum]